MAMDKNLDGVVIKVGPSDAVLELGREYAQEVNLRELGSHERRPVGYYTANHLTGKSDVRDDNATELKW